MSAKKTKLDLARAEIGAELNEEIFAKAVAKAERWMRKAYGGAEWEQLSSSTVTAFYRDTVKNPDGKKTFNRGYS